MCNKKQELKLGSNSSPTSEPIPLVEHLLSRPAFTRNNQSNKTQKTEGSTKKLDKPEEN